MGMEMREISPLFGPVELQPNKPSFMHKSNLYHATPPPPGVFKKGKVGGPKPNPKASSSSLSK